MEPQVKGQTMKSLLLFMQQRLQPAQLEQAMASIDPNARKDLERPILPTNTFPMSLLNRLTVAGAKAASVPLDEFAREAGSFSAAEAVKGVYRFFARVMTTDALLSRAASMWSAMNTAGQMQVTGGKGTAKLSLTNYPSEAVMCLRISGWIEKMSDMSGAKNAVVRHVACVTKGDASCEWTITW